MLISGEELTALAVVLGVVLGVNDYTQKRDIKWTIEMMNAGKSP